MPSTMGEPLRRILLKISGESFGSEKPFEMKMIQGIAREIVQTHQAGSEIGVVIGAGNIVRGAQLHQHGIDRIVGDYMGMLATVINALALEDILKGMGVKTKVMTSRKMEGIGENYHHQRCREYLKDGHIVIFAGGTGSPFFTTDTAAALKAAEINADILFKATKVDGVYERDPVSYSDAKKFDHLSYDQVLTEQYAVMDGTAVVFCRENKIPILIFNLMVAGNLCKAASGQEIGTLICEANQEEKIV